MKLKYHLNILLVSGAINTILMPTSFCQNAKAILKEPVSLEIISSNGTKGSLTLPKGREVEILDGTETSSKISVPNLAQGWVENSSLDMLPPPAPSSTSDVPNEESPKTTTANDNGLSPTSTKTTIPTVRTTVSIDEGEESQGDMCREKQITHKIKVVLSGIKPEEAQNYSTKAYALTDFEGGELRMIPLKELEEGNNSYNYYKRQWTCRCCKDLPSVVLVGHAATAQDKEGNVVASYATKMTKDQKEFLEAQLGHSLN